MSHSLFDINSGLSFAELAPYPEAACLLGAKALKNGDEALVDRLFASLGAAMLPGVDNPWEGPAGEFWREAFKRDPKGWLQSSIGALPKEQAKECARSLLIASAQNGAFECFDYLLSLGAARRSWKILESAYLSGGWRAAEKVKKPTSKEAASLMSYGAEGYRHRESQHTGEGLLWLSKFLEPGHAHSADWLRAMAMSQPPETTLFCVNRHAELKIDISKSNAFSLACALAASKATEATLALITEFKLDVKSSGSGVVEIQLPSSGSSYQRFFPAKLNGPNLVEAALMGLNADCAKELLSKGAPIPSKERLAALWQGASSVSYWQNQCDKLKGPSESLRETLELEASLSHGSSSTRRLSKGL